jgi:cell division protein FtsW
MMQPDLGTTTVLLIIMLALMWVAGSPVSVFTALGVLVGAGGGLLAVTEPYRLARLTGFTNPCAMAKAQDAGYQACQGLYALSSGGWFGLGLGASREKFGYLPNQYTDYIFAIIGEELGLLGTLVVLVLFAVLGVAGVRIAQRCPDRFSQLAATGVTAWLLGQALVNMGAVVGLLPITGIPLPMVSFGGSALVPTLFAIGMLASFARHEPAAAKALAARRAGRRHGFARRLRRS